MPSLDLTLSPSKTANAKKELLNSRQRNHTYVASGGFQHQLFPTEPDGGKIPHTTC